MTQNVDMAPEAPALPEEGMQFRLTYEGHLKSASKSKGRVDHKHEIRRAFHRQLATLWREHPALSPVFHNVGGRAGILLSRIVERDGFKWVPLALEGQHLCEVELLILRRGPPGNFVAAGDIDGQVKTIFDALHIPQEGVLSGNKITPEDDEHFFYVVMLDDAQIVKVTVETDSLLGPLGVTDEYPIQEHKQDARVVLKITTRNALAPTLSAVAQGAAFP